MASFELVAILLFIGSVLVWQRRRLVSLWVLLWQRFKGKSYLKNWEYKTCISLFCPIYGNLLYRVMYHRMNLMLFVRNMTSVGIQSLKTKSVHMDYGNITNGIWSMGRYYTNLSTSIKQSSRVIYIYIAFNRNKLLL